MPPKSTGQKEFTDTLGTFEQGVNSYLPTLLLPKNQLSSSLNTTVRGDYVTQRSIFRKVFIDPDSQKLLNDAISHGQFQAVCYFKPDSNAQGPNGLAEGMSCVIGGQLISIFPDPNVLTAKAVNISFQAPLWVSGTTTYAKGTYASYVVDGVRRDFRTITAVYDGSPSNIAPPNDSGNWQPQNSPNGQNWVWQGEMFVIWNDGVSNPVFYNVDTGTATRSNFGVPIPQNEQVVGPTTMNAPGTTTTLTVTDNSNMSVGDTLYFQNFGNATVLAVNALNSIDVNNINIRTGSVIPNTGGIYWSEVSSTDLPPGRMGTNGKGRNWVSGTNGIEFFASDISGGASGTSALQFRDATLHITENAFLVGGGNFLVPGAVGNIQAMRFVTNLDQSLGQGPLQVFTKTIGFSCQTPVERTDWQNVNNPILTESIKGYGATGQDTTINANSDLLFRSPVGFSSQILARRDFDKWGNVPISIEVSEITNNDDQTLLNWGSAIDFDNRAIFTAKPKQIDRGVIHRCLVPLNFDPLSSLRGKQPSVYDALQWTALNCFHLVTGSFANRERAFAICWDNINQQVDLYEILKSADDSYLDNDIVRITWAFNTASLFRDNKHIFKRLIDGEIYVDELKGTVDFQVWWKPDQYPCFQPWSAWTECQTQQIGGNNPGFRPRMGLGAPYNVQCDPSTNRRLDLGYTFDLRFIITGAVRFLGGTFKCVQHDEPRFAQPNCVNQALLAAMQAIGASGIPPNTPIPSNITVIIDEGGNILIDGDGNVILG